MSERSGTVSIAGLVRGSITPVLQETLHDRVYAVLRSSLFHGVFVGGQMLCIQDLPQKLQTSTMQVREAVARLISERALEALPNRSVPVPVITRERLEDLARARVLIEGEVTARALLHLQLVDFARLCQPTTGFNAAFRLRSAEFESRNSDGAVATLTRDITRAFNLLRNSLYAEEAESRAECHA